MIKKILLVIGVSIESVETQTLKYNKKNYIINEKITRSDLVLVF